MLIGCDRLLLNGRRGTGKTTAVKKYIAEQPSAVLWACRSKAVAEKLSERFVQPAVASILPETEPIGDCVFSFGRSIVRAVALSEFDKLRDENPSVCGELVDLIIHDEYIRQRDGGYIRHEPELHDDLAFTCGRGGKIPQLILIGNPVNNRNPYAYKWRANMLVEGDYSENGRVSRVIGTSDCRDCFGATIGVDAVRDAVYQPFTLTGGRSFTVNGRSITVQILSAGVAVCKSGSGEEVMYNDLYMPRFYTPKIQRYFDRLKEAVYRGKVVYDSFDAELTLYDLLRLKY